MMIHFKIIDIKLYFQENTTQRQPEENQSLNFSA